MNIDLLRKILQEKGVLIKETDKNFITKCVICGDHPNPKKWGHMYISKDSSVPLAHCFFCGGCKIINKYIELITGDKRISNQVLSKEEIDKIILKSKSENVTKKESKDLIVPIIDVQKFPLKDLYIRKRTDSKINSKDIPNLIFDIQEFASINNLSDVMINNVGKNDFTMIHNNYISFLSRNHTMLYCRHINDDKFFPFKKIRLQSRFPETLDYVSLKGGNINSDTIILAEGTFNIIVENIFDSLKIRDRVRLYAAGQSWSYASLLKSVLYDEGIFKVNVIILSDRDKEVQFYNKFFEDSNHVIKSLRIFYNRTGKDFGVFPPVPFENFFNRRIQTKYVKN